MSIKVTSPGRLPEGYDTYRGTCALCGCKVEVDGDDVKTGYSGNDAKYGFFTNCPTTGCKRQIDLEKVVRRG